MAFNFNWSPLIADTSRARDMLTTALNKSPKPPIIVDDIIVTELNLGTTPPELEILEIGDLAEDRFRGIFKMSYTGDAFLTLKTKVQANPLKTYLSNKPDFASPQPLAASSGLTIPLQITLSNIRLSGFVILVFSKQKGLTLVFRNDPLESLKVSSTFDSIPFVRDYLQKEIEGQLRVLFMEDLPAIIHRLSLRLWSPEFQELETEERLEGNHDDTVPIDPLATPPQDAVDAFGNPLNESQISALTLDTSGEVHASFSQKNMLRLAALSESQHTLSLFTPGIRDAVFRAWAGHPDKIESGVATPGLTRGSLSRIQSTFGSMKSGASSVASGSTGNDTHSSRPSLTTANSLSAGPSLGASRSRTGQVRKRKKRVVDLRKHKDGADSGVSTEANSPLPSAYASETSSIIHEEPEIEAELATPPRTPIRPGRYFEGRHGSLDVGVPTRQSDSTDTLLPPAPILSKAPGRSKSKQREDTRPPPTTQIEDFAQTPTKPSSSSRRSRPPLSRPALRQAQQSTSPLLRSLSFDKVSALSSPPDEGASSSGGILEQAWMMKMAQEIARKVQEEKDKADRHRGKGSRSKGAASGGFWAGDDDVDAPPAYVA
ncbi:mitochondrial distribution and morphology protein 34 [Ophiobolus disseminans]|uniref:Mitochondrial distribution and morphology protein 34 n=1 Tax=Ophiobolus disseminans TaxID=1469910 RepID=A0A6A6ZLA9_9PLEO|nr:mitochondrial distribution and morphology protein 34 [Ophiobolus disseminans]